MLIAHPRIYSDQVLGSAFPVPVVGSSGNNVPTSGDVHLYADPGTIFTQSPVLYADCKGLHGGGSMPVAHRLKMQDEERTPPKLAGSTPENSTRTKLKSRTIIFPAIEGKRSKREFAVKELYPRLLYTFSDVIVFVLGESK